MKRKFEVQLEKPSRMFNGWNVVASKACRTERAAIALAHRWLAKHPEVTTRTQRRERCWTVTIVDRRTGHTHMHVEPPQVIVPSVGELGYW